MKWLVQIASAIVFSNLWISAGAALLTAQTFVITQTQFNSGLVLFVFFATLATYNFQRLIRFKVRNNRSQQHRVKWILNNRQSLTTLVAISLFAALIFAVLSLQVSHFALLIPLGATAFFYAFPFLESSRQKFALRDLPGLKIVLIGGTWATTTVVLPLISLEVSVTDTILIAAERFCFIVALTIPFDVRDLKFDQPGLKTIPQLLGSRGAGWLAILFVLFFNAFIWINYLSGYYTLNSVLILSANAAIVLAVLAFSMRMRKELFYSGLLDGLTLLQPIMVYLMWH